jgi:hypothetical protein
VEFLLLQDHEVLGSGVLQSLRGSEVIRGGGALVEEALGAGGLL